jgi:hypothetical protein
MEGWNEEAAGGSDPPIRHDHGRFLGLWVRNIP